MKVYGTSTSRHELVTSTLRNVNIDHVFFYRYIINSVYEVFRSYTLSLSIYIYIYGACLYAYKKGIKKWKKNKKIKNVKKLGSLFVCIYTSLGSLSSVISDLAPTFQVKH
jgi:hypothetical protein